jgi:hypothetical protein
MPITNATAPEASLQVLRSTVQNWVTHPTSAPQAENAGLSFVADGGVDIHLPHPVYNLGLSDLVSGKGLSAAVLVSWRYLLSDGESTAMAEVTQSSGTQSSVGQTHSFSMLNRGPFVASLVQTVDAAEKNATLQAGNYEVAVLHVPALYAMALWLRSQTPGGGTLIPLTPAPASLTAGQSYTEQAFVQALLPSAEQSLKAGGAALV